MPRLRVYNSYIRLKNTSGDIGAENIKCKFYIAPANALS